MKNLQLKNIQAVLLNKMKECFVNKGHSGEDLILQELLPIVGVLSEEQKSSIKDALHVAYSTWAFCPDMDLIDSVTESCCENIYIICSCETSNDKLLMDVIQGFIKNKLEENRFYEIYESGFSDLEHNSGKMKIFVDKHLQKFAVYVSLDMLVPDEELLYSFDDFEHLVTFVTINEYCARCTDILSDGMDFETTIRNYWKLLQAYKTINKKKLIPIKFLKHHGF